MLKQAAVTSAGRFSGNASRPGRIERCSTPEFLHRSRACQQGTRLEPASCPSGPALARHACTLGLCRWEGMRPAALEITSPLGNRSCRMAMALRPLPQVERGSLDAHSLTHETSGPGAPVGDLPRIFTADTLSYRASLYGRRSLRSPKRSGPEGPAFSPGPADGMTGASARGSRRGHPR